MEEGLNPTGDGQSREASRPIEIILDDLEPEPVQSKSDHLVIDLDEEEDLSAQPDSSNLVIDLDDLTEEPLIPSEKNFSPPAKALPKGAGLPERPALLSPNLIHTTLAGLVGGLLAWGLVEPYVLSNPVRPGVGESTLIWDAGLISALAGIALGICLGAVPGLQLGFAGRALKGGMLGALIGMFGGFIGGVIAQSIYGHLSESYKIVGLSHILLRGVGWSIIGLMLGISQSLPFISAKKLRNGILGGATGGLLGGIALQIIQNSYGSGAGTTSRAIAFTAVGLLIGLLIGLVETLMRDAWLSVIEGPLSGKEFVLYQEVTRIGSAPGCDIPLFKDPDVAPLHAEISNHQGAYVIVDNGSETGIYVNGGPTIRALLEEGCIIQIGSTAFRFHEKEPEGKKGAVSQSE